MRGAFTDIVEEFRLDTVLVPNLDGLAKSTRFIDALKRQLIGGTSFNTPIAVFVENVDRIMEELLFEKAFEQQLKKLCLTHILLPHSNLMSPIFDLCISTAQGR